MCIEKLFAVNRRKVCGDKYIVNISHDHSCCYNAFLIGLIHNKYNAQNDIPFTFNKDGERINLINHIIL